MCWVRIREKQTGRENKTKTDREREREEREKKDFLCVLVVGSRRSESLS